MPSIFWQFFVIYFRYNSNLWQKDSGKISILAKLLQPCQNYGLLMTKFSIVILMVTARIVFTKCYMLWSNIYLVLMHSFISKLKKNITLICNHVGIYVIDESWFSHCKLWWTNELTNVNDISLFPCLAIGLSICLVSILENHELNEHTCIMSMNWMNIYLNEYMS